MYDVFGFSCSFSLTLLHFATRFNKPSYVETGMLRQSHQQKRESVFEEKERKEKALDNGQILVLIVLVVSIIVSVGTPENKTEIRTSLPD